MYNLLGLGMARLIELRKLARILRDARIVIRHLWLMLLLAGLDLLKMRGDCLSRWRGGRQMGADHSPTARWTPRGVVHSMLSTG